ncbi:unnamed protein product [Caenorhabditis angaria]|uniref:Uncharacterized protein n=1 Tax=Caenorhabditis angaria TaxID=860376 RepID=A0A9P1IZ41_9PELO|nr:unnamed protein product [Caenorhabditis angaria]
MLSTMHYSTIGNAKIYQAKKCRLNKNTKFPLENVELVCILDRRILLQSRKEKVIRVEDSVSNITIYEDKGFFYLSELDIDKEIDECPVLGFYFNNVEVRICFEELTIVSRLNQMNEDCIKPEFLDQFCKDDLEVVQSTKRKNVEPKKEKEVQTGQELAVEPTKSAEEPTRKKLKPDSPKAPSKSEIARAADSEEEEDDNYSKIHKIVQSEKKKRSRSYTEDEDLEVVQSTKRKNVEPKKEKEIQTGQELAVEPTKSAEKPTRKKLKPVSPLSPKAPSKSEIARAAESEEEEDDNYSKIHKIIQSEDDNESSVSLELINEENDVEAPSSSTSATFNIKRCNVITSTKLDADIIRDQSFEILRQRIDELLTCAIAYKTKPCSSQYISFGHQKVHKRAVADFKEQIENGRVISEEPVISVYEKDDGTFVVLEGTDRVAAMKHFEPLTVRANLVEPGDINRFLVKQFIGCGDHVTIYEKIKICKIMLKMVGAKNPSLVWSDKHINFVFEKVVRKIPIPIIKLCFCDELTEIVENTNGKFTVSQEVVQSATSAYKRRPEECKEVFDEFMKMQKIQNKLLSKRLKRIIPTAQQSLSAKGVRKTLIDSFITDHSGDVRLDEFGCWFPNRSARNTKPSTIHEKWLQFLDEKYADQKVYGTVNVHDKDTEPQFEAIIIHNTNHPLFITPIQNSIYYILSDIPNNYTTQFFISVDSDYAIDEEFGPSNNLVSIYIIQFEDGEMLSQKQYYQNFQENGRGVGRKFMECKDLNHLFHKNVYIDCPHVPPAVVHKMVGDSANIFVDDESSKKAYEKLRQTIKNPTVAVTLSKEQSKNASKSKSTSKSKPSSSKSSKSKSSSNLMTSPSEPSSSA